MKETTLKNVAIANLFDRLLQLDTPPTKQGETPVKNPYNFNAKTLFAFAKNLRILKQAVQDLEDTKAKILEKYRVEGETKIKDEDLAKAQIEFNEVLNAPVQLSFHELNVNELNLGANQIPFIILDELLASFVVGEPS